MRILDLIVVYGMFLLAYSFLAMFLYHLFDVPMWLTLPIPILGHILYDIIKKIVSRET